MFSKLQFAAQRTGVYRGGRGDYWQPPKTISSECAVDNIIVILLVLAAIKFVIIAIILLVVFRPDLKQLRGKKKPPSVPVCMYCQSKWTHALDEGEARWDGGDLILVTTYECEHCHLPFWHVERVPTGILRR